MKKKNLKLLLVIFLAICIIVPVSLFLWTKESVHLSKVYYAQVRNNPQVYVYDDFLGAINPVMYITDTADRKELIGFYMREEKEKKTSSIIFSIKYMPFPDPVFLIGYSKDSSLAIVADFDTNCWGHIQGYVYYKNIHRTLPNDTLIKEYYKHLTEIEEANAKDLANAKYGKSMEYGIQCQ